eukprot:GHRR01034261.1.p1 GENE.GHRR01034261.1~~GHRR01034261.1.p1  ORF type:complete len:124 (-),score=47.75 GHRR01034261.1:646-1017(-)
MIVLGSDNSLPAADDAAVAAAAAASWACAATLSDAADGMQMLLQAEEGKGQLALREDCSPNGKQRIAAYHWWKELPDRLLRVDGSMVDDPQLKSECCWVWAGKWKADVSLLLASFTSRVLRWL